MQYGLFFPFFHFPCQSLPNMQLCYSLSAHRIVFHAHKYVTGVCCISMISFSYKQNASCSERFSAAGSSVFQYSTYSAPLTAHRQLSDWKILLTLLKLSVQVQLEWVKPHHVCDKYTYTLNNVLDTSISGLQGFLWISFIYFFTVENDNFIMIKPSYYYYSFLSFLNYFFIANSNSQTQIHTHKHNNIRQIHTCTITHRHC